MFFKLNKNVIYLKNLDVNKLKQNINVKGLLNKEESGIYIYESRQYKILNYKIKPRIFLLIKYEVNSIEIICKKIDLNIDSKINSILHIKIDVKIKKFNQGIKLERVMELGLVNEEKLKIMPNAIKEFLLDKAISISSKRFDKRLIKKIVELESYSSS
tara:strand:- start:54 stop:527 length:474 start_codon:yes stop_codon:yes gene_type:complete